MIITALALIIALMQLHHLPWYVYAAVWVDVVYVLIRWYHAHNMSERVNRFIFETESMGRVLTAMFTCYPDMNHKVLKYLKTGEEE